MAARARVATAGNVAALPWLDFAELFRRKHSQGEHVAIVGPTGSGKTRLGLELCKIIGSRTADDGRPARVVVFATKPRDRTLSALGWSRISEWPPGYGQEHAIVWPRAGDPETKAARQRRVFGPVMRAIYSEGGQTVYIDEVSYFERSSKEHGLGLAATVQEYWESARALDLTLVAGTQRPRNVGVSMWTEPTWVCVFRLEDRNDLKRVAEMGDRDTLEAVHDRLGGHEFVCVHRPRGGRRAYYVSRVGG